jgi:hypothetical protein
MALRERLRSIPAMFARDQVETVTLQPMEGYDK